MIHCNLSVLLAERKLKITRVSAETGISRTTLTALANSNGQGVQFDTLNNICIYLGVTPNELLSFIPFDIGVSDADFIHADDDGFGYLELYLTLNKREIKESFQLNCCIEYVNKFDMYEDEYMAITVTEIDKSFYFDILKKLPHPFLKDIEDKIFDSITAALKPKGKDTRFYSFNWEPYRPEF